MLLLAFSLSACTEGATSVTSTPRSSGVVVAAAGAGGSDVGNDRPHVTYDGLMVRRRVVIAIQPLPGASLVSLRRRMNSAATQRHTTLSSISPDVLDPAVLEHLVPEVTVVLPAGKTLAGARELMDPASSRGGRSRSFPGVASYQVASVLVHDLRFTVRSAEPAVLADAIAREGILSDALGSYTTSIGRGVLDVAYTGPLLSDSLVASVRGGIARRAGTASAAVTISPRSGIGAGVDMAREPAPASAVEDTSTAHQHGR
ncbi:MAG: hypothetical protein QOE58_1321 [Actinomycetota bacterium]|nr:hypothetical protein [Actinomycetota bacterium]